MTSYVSHLEGAIDGATLPAHQVHTLHENRPIWVRYDLDAVKANMSKEKVASRAPDLWRYRELLPPLEDSSIVSLGEGMSPLLNAPRLGAEFGLRNVLVKDESQLPTGSFKSRGLAMAITMANQFGIKRVALPTAGNAGGAAAWYAARAGMEAYVFMPEDTPIVNQLECQLAGAHCYLVDGLITDCGRIVKEGKEAMKWFDLSTLKEPYRIEGKKTMGLELAEQLDWELPDVILYPTGGGTGLIGMWKAFAELAALGWLHSEKLPRMVAVQSTGCAPIATAFEAGERFATPFENAATMASGIRVPAAVGDFMILDAVRESGGRSLAVEEQKLPAWMQLGCRTEGIAICPETAACIGALESLSAEGWVKPDESVVIFNTGAAFKYSDVGVDSPPLLSKDKPINWANM